MTLMLKGARLIDGTGGAPLDDAVLVLEGQRITAVGPEEKIDAPEGDATVVDVQGRTILPGLMDLHVGLVALAEEEKPYLITEKNIAAAVLRGAATGKRYLDIGVTTIRADLSGHHGVFALKEAFANGTLDGPRMVVPGRAICMTGGHAWRGNAREADGPDGVRQAAREELKAGADWIKLMATGGAATPTERIDDVQMTVEEMKVAVEEAHKKGKYAFAHVTCSEGARNAIAAGVDSIEHGIGLEDDVLLAMKEKGTFLVPTLGAYHRLVQLGEKGLVPEFMYRKSVPVVASHFRSFQAALQAGVKIAAGTDSGYNWYPGGESLLGELELMNRLGMSSMEVLISATSRAAECLRMQGELGTVEPGKIADLLVVEGDPLSDISALRNTWMVFKEGCVVRR